MLGLHMMQTGKTSEKVQMPEGAAEFAVGHSLEAVLHFLFHEILDEAVFERGERGTIEFPGLKSVTRVEQFFGAQKAADDISTIRGLTWDIFFSGIGTDPHSAKHPASRHGADILLKIW